MTLFCICPGTPLRRPLCAWLLSGLLSALASAAVSQTCGAADVPCEVAQGDYHLSAPEAPPRAIVMHLHGGGATGKGMLGSEMARAAVARSFLFVAPNGIHPESRWNKNWSVRANGSTFERDDAVFLRAVRADVRDRYGTGLPLLLSGFSRGASMVWDIACADPDFADGYAPLAGAFWEDLPQSCTGPVRLFHTHGWNDRVVPFEGRSFRNGAVVQGDVWAALKLLRETNGCAARQPEASGFDGDQWLRHWSDCEEGRIDLLVHPGGHGAPPGWAARMLDWFEALT